MLRRTSSNGAPHVIDLKLVAADGVVFGERPPERAEPADAGGMLTVRARSRRFGMGISAAISRARVMEGYRDLRAAETCEQVQHLRARGIRRAQGYVFAPPLPGRSSCNCWRRSLARPTTRRWPCRTRKRWSHDRGCGVKGRAFRAFSRRDCRDIAITCALLGPITPLGPGRGAVSHCSTCASGRAARSC
jgi:hypothetical protein